MGYETKLYIVEPGTDSLKEAVYLYDEVGRFAYCDDTISCWYFYDQDNNKTFILECDLFSKTMNYGSVLAMVGLSNLPKGAAISKLHRDSKNTNTYIFNDDGDTLKIVDMYGEPLKEATLSEAIEALSSDSREYDYRRIHSALAVLKSFNNKQYRDVIVLFYGH